MQAGGVEGLWAWGSWVGVVAGERGSAIAQELVEAAGILLHLDLQGAM